MVAGWTPPRTSSRSPTRGRVQLAAGLAAVVIVSCGTSDADLDASSPQALAESLGCADISELDPMIAPIRGDAATSGISCTIDDEAIHIFARAPIGDSSGTGFEQGGTVENIRRLLEANFVDPDCELAALISDHVFVVGTTADQLTRLGIPGDEPIPVSPMTSYLDHCTIE
jgi:hypothetical protein